jgi:ABC-type dipeptide/oligopeptide/nickel transport system permease subunit
MRYSIYVITMFTIGLTVGLFAGHYHGKAVTLERFISQDITCTLAIDPITEGMMK